MSAVPPESYSGGFLLLTSREETHNGTEQDKRRSFGIIADFSSVRMRGSDQRFRAQKYGREFAGSTPLHFNNAF